MLSITGQPAVDGRIFSLNLNVKRHHFHQLSENKRFVVLTTYEYLMIHKPMNFVYVVSTNVIRRIDWLAWNAVKV